MPTLLTASKVARRMSKESENAEDSLFRIITNPSKTLANWYFWLGSLGLLLAGLNLIGEIHPNYRVSWGGLLTFEYWNQTFEHKDTAAAFVASDAIFITICGLITFTGAKSLIGEESVGDWFTSLITNEWYKDLVEPGEGGWSLILGTWSMLASVLTYFYWGIMHTSWIDPGIYSWSIVLMGSGLVMRMLSSIEDEE
tara:strand:- start:7936 stop:8526 length:591 start_codon:yes stop_codon:yes gene_type:complete